LSDLRRCRRRNHHSADGFAALSRESSGPMDVRRCGVFDPSNCVAGDVCAIAQSGGGGSGGRVAGRVMVLHCAQDDKESL